MKANHVAAYVILPCLVLISCLLLSGMNCVQAAIVPDTAIKKELEALFLNPPDINGFPYEKQLAQAAEHYNLPLPFVTAVARGESFFRPDAKSAKGAIGIMQVMPATAGDYGVSEQELLDPEKNIDVGVHYLADLYSRLKDPYLTLAAYYCGCGGVDKEELTLRKDCDDYVHYIHTHLHTIMASAGAGTHSGKTPEKYFVLTVFDNFLDAENFLKFMNKKLPARQFDTFRTEVRRKDHMRYQYQILAAYREEKDKKRICEDVLDTTGFSFCSQEGGYSSAEKKKGQAS